MAPGPIIITTLLLLLGFLPGVCPHILAQSLPVPDVITVEDGLCFRHVNSIVQDKNGLMWFGTANGLNRYDGYRLISFGKGTAMDKPFPALDFPPDGALFYSDSVLWTIADFQVWATNIHSFRTIPITGYEGRALKMARGKNDDIWLVSDNDSEQFLWRYTGLKGFEKIGAVPHMVLDASTIQIDTSGGVWWSTNARGLRHYSPAGEMISETKIDSRVWSGTTLYHNDFFIDSRNRFFIYSNNPHTDQQIWLYDPVSGKKEVLFKGMAEFNFTAAEDRWGNVWLSKEDGLIKLLPDGTVTDYTQPALQALDFKNIFCIYEDSRNTLWVGTDGGILKFPVHQPFFDAIFARENSGWGNAMRGICQNSAGDIFFLHESDTAALYRIGKEEAEVEKTALEMSGSDELYPLHRAKYLVYDEKRNCIWTMTNTLLKIDIAGQKIESYPAVKFDREYSTFNPVDLLPDGQLLVGNTLDKLCFFHPESGRVQRLFENNSSSYFRIYPKVLLADDAGDRFWVGTHDRGLYLFNLKGELLKHYHSASDPALPNNHVTCLYTGEDQQLLWVGTLGGGFCSIDFDADSVSVYNREIGLPDNNVASILGDGDNLWIGTYNGLSAFSKKDRSFRNFYVEDGLTHNEFNYASAFRSKDGQMYFGGLNGINRFHPNNLSQQEFNPPLQLTRFVMYDQARDSLYDVTLTGDPGQTFEVPPAISFFRLEWTLPNYSNPDKNQYFIWTEGLEAGWTFLGNTPHIRFNKLPAGDYTLHVKGKDNRGNWSEKPLKLQIQVLAPWWKRWWAFGLYFLVAFAGITLIARRELARIRLQDELQREQKEAQRLAELDEAKTRFFSNISHEFRTPLTVILGMSEEIKEQGDAKHLIQRSGRNLLRLVNQLLDFSMLGARKLRLQLQKGDLVAYLHYLVENFHSLAAHKNLHLSFESSVEQLEMDYDEEKIQHIVSNLLSNAIKFTPRDGQVALSLSILEEMVCIQVRDTGTGIPAAALPRIFERYYQVDNPMSKGEPGSGIGLAFTRELVELMGGKIEVESEVGAGTVFRVLLPGTEPNAEALVEDTQPLLMPVDEKAVAAELLNKDAPAPSRSSLLIIEDNPEVVSYIRTILEREYDISVAENGAIGIQKAVEQIPDIIISDVMMPGKDGFEVTDFLKNDERSSHIPIVLLTAKADAESRLTGLTRGADAYLAKPFDKRELQVRLQQLIALRKKLQSRYAQFEGYRRPTEDAGLRIEDAFLQKINRIIEAHLKDPEFGVRALCTAAGLSRPQLFRKLKALTGKSIVAWLRSARLHKARALIGTGKYNISEAAYEAGFNDPLYFSRMFSKEFGFPPSDMLK